MTRIAEKRLTRIRAAELLGMSERQVRRLYAAYEARGAADLAGGLPGAGRRRRDGQRLTCARTPNGHAWAVATAGRPRLPIDGIPATHVIALRAVFGASRGMSPIAAVQTGRWRADEMLGGSRRPFICHTPRTRTRTKDGNDGAMLWRAPPILLILRAMRVEDAGAGGSAIADGGRGVSDVH